MKTQAPPAQRSRGVAKFEWLNYVLGQQCDARYEEGVTERQDAIPGS